MGSIGAMRRGSRDRYFQDEFDLEAAGANEKLVPEGIEGRVAHKGSVARWSPTGRRSPRRDGLLRRAQHSHAAARGEAHSHHAAGARESHVHDVAITKEAPNYRSE